MPQLVLTQLIDFVVWQHHPNFEYHYSGIITVSIITTVSTITTVRGMSTMKSP